MTAIFESFFAGGFECSSHRRADGRRLDVIDATAHDRHAARDYRLLQRHGMGTARDGLRWHLIEENPGRYDFSSVLAMRDAAHETGMAVIWDLLHYGWPDWIDPWNPDFPARFADFAFRAAEVMTLPGAPAAYVPVNEISFLAWGGGEVGYLNPFTRGRGDAMKVVLADAFLRAARAIRSFDPAAAIVCAEPLIKVHPWWQLFGFAAARGHSESQHEALDMLLGRARPELGGHPQAVDLVGINYYPQNQWMVGGRKVRRGHPLHVPLRELLAAMHMRYGLPMAIAETGCEAAARPGWLRYVVGEVLAARRAGADIRGVCLYPVLNHLGWDDDRYCPNGLFCGVEADGRRSVYTPLADELARLRGLVEAEDRRPPTIAGHPPMTQPALVPAE